MQSQDADKVLKIRYSTEFMNNRSPLFWYSCFVRLFPRGDCWETCRERPRHLSCWRWAKTLLTRGDCKLWRQDVEFIASVYNIHLRRAQLNAVETCMRMRSFSAEEMRDLSGLTATNLMATALASGDVNSVREALRKKNLDQPVKTALNKMMVIHRTVRGSEGEKDCLMPKFFALRVWSGCSSLFFTLNPHDIKSPISLSLLQNDVTFEKRFSLDFSDQDTEAYIKDVLKDHPKRLHDAVASNPLVATKCFHWTVKLVIRILFHCDACPGLALDSIAAKETMGIFGHVRAYLGIVEPQMRKALHIHMLVQLVGFSHPEDLFDGDMIPDMFKRLWAFVASICFRSTEAFADYLNVDEAMRSLQEEPPLLLTKKQKDMIGEERAHASMHAQKFARGLDQQPETDSFPAKISYITSTVHSNALVNAGQWSRFAVKAVAASTRSSGNHICRADVCHKGAIGKKGFCRMLFWHWAYSVDSDGKRKAKRSHGLPLQKRWDGSGLPPLYEAPPWKGSPALEITHPFHFKMTPSIMLGPTCNHDLGVLLRWGGCNKETTGETLDKKEVCASMLDSMGDHEYYCASYSSKDQPHVDSLLVTLTDGYKQKSRDLWKAREAGEEISDHDASKKILHSLVAATNRRMHKGFQEMLTYLLHKPMDYCSHAFVAVFMDTIFRGAISNLLSRINPSSSSNTLFGNHNMESGLRIPEKPFLNVQDYRFRPRKLENFPLYFFMSACEATKTLGADSMEWLPLTTENGETHMPRGYNPNPMRCKSLPECSMKDEQGNELHEYDYYVKLRTHTAWRVPLFHGKCPPRPVESASAKEKGSYALWLMLLFRPHRQLHDFVSLLLGAEVVPEMSIDRVWETIHQEFLRWRSEDIEAPAKAARHRIASLRPPFVLKDTELMFDSQEWWVTMIAEKIRNYDVAKKRHDTDTLARPTDLSNLPLYHGPSNGSAFNSDYHDTDPLLCMDEETEEVTKSFDCMQVNDTKPSRREVRKDVPFIAVHCGTLPSGTGLHDYLQPPKKVSGRMSSETMYWTGFSKQIAHVFPTSLEQDSTLVRDTSWGLSAAGALQAAEHQHSFFKAVDTFEMDFDTPQEKTWLRDSGDPHSKAINAAMNKLSPNYGKTPTIVMESAFHLLKEGLLNIPDLGIINVKQARAFLWNAAWLQEYMVNAWRKNDFVTSVSQQEHPFLRNFCLLIVGAGGTGKTAVLRLTEALTIFFAGEETVKKCAPSNAAARLLGGDTIHAMCKTPFGNKVHLSSKKGILTKNTLMKHRKKWASTIATYMDEVSMISADQFLHVDVRLRQAKMEAHCAFGNLAMNICGDFLQLPPVDKDGTKRSLATDIDDMGEPVVTCQDSQNADVEIDDEQTVKHAAEAMAENRQGRELWTSIKRVVSLKVNVRAPDILSRLQDEMRNGCISDEMWDLYTSRILLPEDDRLAQAPFSDHDIHFIVHRHKIRAMRALANAQTESRKRGQPLYMITARDEALTPEDNLKVTDSVRSDLLRYVNPDLTKGYASFLPIYRGMKLLLASKDCVRLGVMKGATAVVRDIIFSDDEILPFEYMTGEVHHLVYMPVSLLLQVEEVSWVLPSSELPKDLPEGIQRAGLFQLRPSCGYLRVKVGENEWISVRRTGFLATPADTITVHASQGSNFRAVIADMQKPPNLTPTQHWLACYVMLSRARSLAGFLVLRPATRKELSSKPPQYLIDEIDRLSKLEEVSHEELCKYIEALPLDIPAEVQDILKKDAAEKESVVVEAKRKCKSHTRSSVGLEASLRPSNESPLPSTNAFGMSSACKKSLTEKCRKYIEELPSKIPAHMAQSLESLASLKESVEAQGKRKRKSDEESTVSPSYNEPGQNRLRPPNQSPVLTTNSSAVSLGCKKRLRKKTRPPSAIPLEMEDTLPQHEEVFAHGTDSLMGVALLGGLVSATVSVAAAGISDNPASQSSSDDQEISLSNPSEDMVDNTVESSASSPDCVANCHHCKVDIEKGCSSCHRTCHRDCSDAKCQYTACALCMSMSLNVREDSEICRQCQVEAGCHHCGKQECWASNPRCRYKAQSFDVEMTQLPCTKYVHHCGPGLREGGCSSCGRRCHNDNKDTRCLYFNRKRDRLAWNPSQEDFQDTVPGSQGQRPHRTQIAWRFTPSNFGPRRQVNVDGRDYYVGYGDPGHMQQQESNNCLIDSLRQCLNLQCDRKKVRADLLLEFGQAQGSAKVSHSSHLDAESHWRCILTSLLQNCENATKNRISLEDLCVVVLCADNVNMGAVHGDVNARRRLIVLNYGNRHFDPVLPLDHVQPLACTAKFHRCGPSVANGGCVSCGHLCHSDNSDTRCAFFSRNRDQLDWTPSQKDLQDTLPGSQGQIPHFTQISWHFIDSQFVKPRRVNVDGRDYYLGNASPIGNNCLIDSLRQCLHLQCDRKKVRADLLCEFGQAQASARVHESSFLDAESHWKSIIKSLLRHCENATENRISLEDLCLVVLFADNVAMGAVHGDVQARRRLVVLNTGSMHFDPVLPL